jgi:hypothetical protein
MMREIEAFEAKNKLGQLLGMVERGKRRCGDKRWRTA